MTAQMAIGKAVIKVPNTTNPIIDHELHAWELTSVVVQTVNPDGTRTPATPAYTVLDRDRIQLTLATNGGATRWAVVSA